MENAFQIGRAIGEPGEAQKERIVDLADSLERLTPAERSILGAHYHYMLRTPEFRARPLDLWKHDVPSRYRIVKSLYVAVSADGTLYDVIVEQLEMLLDNEGMDGRRTVSGLIPARQVVLRYARPEYGPEKWTGLAREDAQLLSWIAARPRANMSDLEARARQLGLESHEALLRIKKWVETEPALGAGDRRRLSVPSPDQRP
ncbi:hypothetical protein [Sphingomonas sp. 3-13AW]|uniref:hypothetical protein n=1 Tax=Sphingomonas sp. 3-13AW TaxID=3050450 RepID=UPI003BB7C039